MTPRELAERTGVSTAAISQWSKPLIEKGVLTWCDETGVVFGDDLALEKAKRSGKAFLCVAGGKSLPSPFQLTGDPRWDKGGDLYAAYDLQLDDGSGDDDRLGLEMIPRSKLKMLSLMTGINTKKEPQLLRC